MIEPSAQLGKYRLFVVSSKISSLLEELRPRKEESFKRDSHELMTVPSKLHLAIMGDVACWYRTKTLSFEDARPLTTYPDVPGKVVEKLYDERQVLSML